MGRRPRRSPPSTWPSSGRPSRSLRRWRSVPSSLLFSKSKRKPTQPQNCSVEFGKKSGPFCKPLESKQPCRYKSCHLAKTRTPIDVSHFPSGGALWFILNVCRHRLVSKFLYPQKKKTPQKKKKKKKKKKKS